MAVAHPARSTSVKAKVRAYYELTKPGITLMVVLSAAAGYILALPEGPRGLGVRIDHFLFTLMGILLVSGGSGALNHYTEWVTDRLMSRTRHRPIASGVLAPRQGLVWGIVLCFLGLGVLLFVDFVVLLLATVTIVTYLVVYTPMKRLSPAALFVGAVPGALPVAGGWIAASGIGWGAGLVFLLLYFWQLPHFLALSWLYRKDYAQAGFPMAAVLDTEGRWVGWQLVISSALLWVVSVLLGIFLRGSELFVVGMAALSLWLVLTSVGFLWHPTFVAARRVLRSAYVYLFGFVALALLARI
ncbi:MAG: heme o synthase [Candidatus Kapabacteria bacterium]|nr:heme o synthase [Candidatus Kapabacteria bacterium]MCS7170060.1 heme o synthase [Candidatus Kapabacteria bacterium]